MQSVIQGKRATMRTEGWQGRLAAIRNSLRRGDITSIARQEAVTREWVSKVINGWGTSEPVLQATEQLIRERNQTNQTIPL